MKGVSDHQPSNPQDEAHDTTNDAATLALFRGIRRQCWALRGGP